MPRLPKRPDDPAALDHYLGVYVTRAMAEAVAAYAAELGVSKSDAIRILISAGLKGPASSPFTPKEESK